MTILHSDLSRDEQQHLFIECLYEPDDLLEVRLLPSGKSFWYLAKNLQQSVNELMKQNQAGQNIHFGANPRKEEGRKTEHVKLARSFCADFDQTVIEAVRERLAQIGFPDPTVIANSGHGVHCYWRLDQPMSDLRSWSQFQKRIARLLGSDPKVCDAPRLMRLPGFTNHKEPAAFTVLIEAEPARVFSLAGLEALLPTLQASIPCNVRAEKPIGSSAEVRAIAYLAMCKPAIEGHSGHDQTMFVARAVVYGFDLGAERGLQILLVHYNPRCQPPWTEAELRHKCEEADSLPFDKPRGWLRNQHVRDHRQLTSDDLLRQTIVIGVDEHRVNQEAMQALACEKDIYQRGGSLVHVIEINSSDEPSAIRRPVGAPVVRELSLPLLRERLTRSVDWIKQGTEGSWYPVHPPVWSIKAIHARGQWPTVRHLEGVVSHPVLLRNGQILSENGYDCSSRLLLSLPANLDCSIPIKPTHQDIDNAVALLFDVVSDFPFESPVHRSAWLAGLLTPLAWFAFDGPAPLFLLDSNTRGVGKGLLADVIALIVSGRRFPTMAYSNDREELRKKITSLAVEGERLVLMDNLTGAVGNAILDSALTSDRWKDRLLGGNLNYDGPLDVTWFATGNNVQLLADTARRVCHIRMETSEESPELRNGFKYPNLRDYILHNRCCLLTAAFTILRGWIVAGRPTFELKPWGSFEGWSGVVREAVVYAGLSDPGETRLALQAESDRDAHSMGVLLRCLHQMENSNQGITVAEIIDSSKNSTTQHAWQNDLRSVVEELCGKLDARTLGYRLRHFQRRNFGGLMLVKGTQDRTNVNRWRVVSAKDESNKSKITLASPATPSLETTTNARNAGYAGSNLAQDNNEHISSHKQHRQIVLGNLPSIE